MKRTAFKRKPLPPSRARVRQWEGVRMPTPRAVVLSDVVARERLVVPIGKLRGYQHQGYMAIVRTFACERCGWYRKGSMQFCHRDCGKGFGIKTDCREGWCGCGPHDGVPGCHWLVGTSGRMPKTQRRAFELEAGQRTRARVEALGKWPPRLPKWEA